MVACCLAPFFKIFQSDSHIRSCEYIRGCRTLWNRDTNTGISHLSPRLGEKKKEISCDLRKSYLVEAAACFSGFNSSISTEQLKEESWRVPSLASKTFWGLCICPSPLFIRAQDRKRRAPLRLSIRSYFHRLAKTGDLKPRLPHVGKPLQYICPLIVLESNNLEQNPKPSSPSPTTPSPKKLPKSHLTSP